MKGGAQEQRASLPVDPQSICFTYKKEIHPGSPHYNASLIEAMGRRNRVWDMVSIKPPSGNVVNIPICVREVGSGGTVATSRIEEAKESGGRDQSVPDEHVL